MKINFAAKGREIAGIPKQAIDRHKKEALARYFIELSYKGTAYHGWQVQPNANTVQEQIDKALSTILREPIETLGCGRTDTGVHARQFFAHFDAQKDILPEKIQGFNAVLPYDIAIKHVFPVPADAHARFDALSRSYEYHIHFAKDPFLEHASWLMGQVPDIEAMNMAAAYLFDYIDFSCFSKSHTQVFTNNCRISRAEWVLKPDGMIFHITADRFLRNMVRAIVGTLLDIGFHKIKPEDIKAVIESKDRSSAGVSVPAHGLYLSRIDYPYISS